MWKRKNKRKENNTHIVLGVAARFRVENMQPD